MPTPDRINATVMIADVCRSTWLFDTLGDEKAAEVVAAVLQQAAAVVGRYHGRVLRSRGDDLLCLFEQPADALRAALEIHAAPLAIPDHGDLHCEMRVGIHAGPLLYADGELYGDTVNVAARLSELAKGSQTVLSGEVRAGAEGFTTGWFRPLSERSLQGKPGPMLLFELLDPGEQDEITQVGEADLFMAASNRLTLRFQSVETTLNYLLVRYLLGRSPECDLVLDHPLVSRQHAEIRYHNGAFTLQDFSTNGTVLISRGELRLLHRGQAELRGKGSLFLGRTNYNHKFEITWSASGGSRSFS
jgi:class 3 adenylate cyclase